MRLLHILIAALICCYPIGCQPAFPIAPAGMCMDGVRMMSEDSYFASQDLQFAYDPMQNHVWIIANGQPWDSYYGRMDRTYQNMYPRYVYATYDEMARDISERTRRYL